MGPYESIPSLTDWERTEDRRLQAARESFPHHDIIETFGGFLAVPKGTVIVQAVSLDALVVKLRGEGKGK